MNYKGQVPTDKTYIKADDGYFNLYATVDIRNTPVHCSADLIDWEEAGPHFQMKCGLLLNLAMRKHTLT